MALLSGSPDCKPFGLSLTLISLQGKFQAFSSKGKDRNTKTRPQDS